MEDVAWKPADMDVTKPSPARVYDYLLGGTHNFEADREAAEKFITASPQNIRKAMWIYRRFLRRVVRHCLAEGVTQFLDLGSGLPTMANIHETAQQINPGTRVVYVDIDPVAYTHCRLLLQDNPNAAAVHADLRDTEKVLNAPEVTHLLDFDQPLALIMAAVLHFIPDSDKPADVINRYTRHLAPGSYLAVTHGSDEEEKWRAEGDTYRQAVANVYSRSRAEIKEFFTEFELVEPGVAWIEDWPHDPNETYLHDLPTKFAYAAIGRKP